MVSPVLLAATSTLSPALPYRWWRKLLELKSNQSLKTCFPILNKVADHCREWSVNHLMSFEEFTKSINTRKQFVYLKMIFCEVAISTECRIKSNFHEIIFLFSLLSPVSWLLLPTQGTLPSPYFLLHKYNRSILSPIIQIPLLQGLRHFGDTGNDRHFWYCIINLIKICAYFAYS